MKKRGVSGIVVAVLVIAIVMVAVTIVYNIITPMLKESAGRIQTETLTTNLELQKATMSITAEEQTITIPVTRPAGVGNVVGIKFIFDNTTDTYVHEEPTDIQELETRIFMIIVSKINITTPTSVSAAFIVEFNGEEFTSEIKDTQEIIEVPPEPPAGGEPLLCPGDVNGDNFVGGADLTIILSNWGKEPATRADGDLNNDGKVGGADYTRVLSNWGKSCEICDIFVSECQELNQEGKKYCLTNDIIIPTDYMYHCFNITANHVALNCKNFKIETGAGLVYDGIISVYNANSSLIENCNLSGQNMGIYLSNSNDNYILNNNINRSYFGIAFRQSSGNTIINNVISNSIGEIAINFQTDSSDNIIRGNTLTGSGISFYSPNSPGYPSLNNLIEKNFINLSSSGTGVSILYGSNNIIKGNIVENAKYKGIQIGQDMLDYYGQNNYNNTVESNEIYFTSYHGIYLFGNDSKIIGNNVSYSGIYDILLLGKSSNNIIMLNRIDTLEPNSLGGIAIYAYSNNNTIQNNSVLNGNYGIFIVSQEDNRLAFNYVHNNKYYDIFCCYASDVRFLENDYGNMYGCPAGLCISDEECNPGEFCDNGICKSKFEPRCYPFMTSVWSSDGGILANGVWDRSGSAGSYLSVVPTADGGYALRAPGELGVHRYERVVVKDFQKPLQTWGGTIYVNIKNVNLPYYTTYPLDLAFAGGYRSSSDTQRDLGIASLANSKIYLKGYEHSSKPGADCEKAFDLPDNPITDRFIRVDWFFTPKYALYARVDNGRWKKIRVGTEKIDFTRFDVGWVSSYSGGSVDIKDVSLYNESCVPQWVLDN